jgi:hypothetical protein
MLPWMPHLALWGSPLYNELCLGLCRALAGPWLGACRAREKASLAQSAAAPSDWRVLERDAGRPIGARSLAELRVVVRDGRQRARKAAGSEVAGGEARNPVSEPAG